MEATEFGFESGAAGISGRAFDKISAKSLSVSHAIPVAGRFGAYDINVVTADIPQSEHRRIRPAMLDKFAEGPNAQPVHSDGCECAHAGGRSPIVAFQGNAIRPGLPAPIEHLVHRGD